MDKYKGLLQNIGLFAISNFATRLISFVLVPLYTLYLSQGDFGITDMTSTVIWLFTPIVTLSIADATLRFMIDDKENQNAYSTIGVTVTLIGLAMLVFLLPILKLPVFGGLDKWSIWFYLCASSQIFQTYLSNVARGVDETKQMALSSFFSSVVTGVSAVVCLAGFRLGLTGYFLSLFLGVVAGCVWYLAVRSIRQSIKFPSHVSWKYLKPMLLYALPLIPNSLFWWINQCVSRFFITADLGIAMTGLFAAGSKIPNLLNVIQNVFQQAWNLSAFQQFKAEGRNRFFTITLRVYSLFLVIGTGLLIVLSPVLAKILLQKSFFKAWVLVPLLLLSVFYTAMANFMGSVFTASFKTNELFVTTFVGALVCTVLTWILVKRFGVTGACVASLLSNAIVYGLRVISSRRVIRLDLHIGLICIEGVLLVAMALLEVRGTIGMVITGVIFMILCAVELIGSRNELRLLVRTVQKQKPKNKAAVSR